MSYHGPLHQKPPERLTNVSITQESYVERFGGPNFEVFEPKEVYHSQVSIKALHIRCLRGDLVEKTHKG